MNVIKISTDKLIISNFNARKQIDNDDNDETTIKDLAFDIKNNGLLNPLTVRKNDNDRYEIIAGQRRFLAIKLLDWIEIPCNLLDIDDEKAQVVSLIENMQRNSMTYCDKTKAFAKLHELYNYDTDILCKMVSLTKKTVLKYLTISKLPENIIEKMDAKNENKITMDVAYELTKIKNYEHIQDIMPKLNTMSNQQKIEAIKIFNNEVKQNNDVSVEIFDDIKENVVLKNNNIKLVPSVPYVKDSDGNFIIIPEDLYESIIEMIELHNNRAV